MCESCSPSAAVADSCNGCVWASSDSIAMIKSYEMTLISINLNHFFSQYQIEEAKIICVANPKSVCFILLLLLLLLLLLFKVVFSHVSVENNFSFTRRWWCWRVPACLLVLINNVRNKVAVHVERDFAAIAEGNKGHLFDF